MILTFVVGDWSKDGHSISESFVVESNLNSQEVTDAYNKGSDLIGFNLSEQVACDYQDPTISKEYANKIMEFYPEYFKLGNEPLLYFEEDKVYIDSDCFLILYLEIARLGNPKFKYSVNKKMNKINIGGYGLFN